MMSTSSIPVVRFQVYRVPEKYIELASQVLGEIDLDPVFPNQSERFTADTGWLNEHWYGRVWMCPPFDRQLIRHYVEKLLAEFAAGRVTEAIVLTHNSTDTKWWHRLAENCACFCGTRGRIRFMDPEGDPCSPTQGHMFFYFGQSSQRFREIFGNIGFIRPRVETAA